MPPIPKQGAPRRDIAVESLLVLALAAQLLLLAALVLHGPEDRFSRGFVGAVGHFAGSVVYGVFGVMSFVLVALGLWTTALRLLRNELSAPRWRLAGFMLLVLGGCTIVAKIFPDSRMASASERPWGFAAGGSIGESMRDLLIPAVGHFGTVLLAVVLLCTGLAFATDWLLYEMFYGGAKKVAGLGTYAKRFWPEPALATPGAADSDTFGDVPSVPARSDRASKSAIAGPDDAFGPAAPLAFTPAAPTPLVPLAAPQSAVAGSTPPSPTAPVSVFAPRTEPRPDRFDDFEVEDPEIVVPADLAERLAPLPPKMEPIPPTPAAPIVTKTPAVASVADASNDDKADDSANDHAFGEGLGASVAAAVDESVDATDAPAPVVATLPTPRAAIVETPKPPRPAGPRVERPRTDGQYEFPSHQLLERPKPRNMKQLESAIRENADVLQRTLQEFKIEGQVVGYQQGPVVTMLEVALAPGTKVTKIHSLADDISMALKAESVRIVAPIPGKSTVGVEIPNPVRDDVRMLGVLESEQFLNSKAAIPMLLGASADGGPLVEDLAVMPHLLIAGSTGSGKSVCINTILLSILMTRSPDEVRLILIDPKQVELAFFADVPHLLSPVVTDMKRASAVLEWALDKMEERYDLLRRFEVRNIASYNELGETAILARAKELEMDDEVVQVKLAYIVIVVDELADLMLTVGKDVETAITRLAQKSRAVGIHVILATQRPSTDVITGLIKANMPTRIAFKVASKVDSRVILDQNGAEKLLGMGDMLYMPPRSSTIARAQCTYASDREVKRVVGYLRERYPQEFSDELVNLSSAPLLEASEKDELYDQAVRIVLGEQRGSASLLQRALSIGYTRSSRLLDLMRTEGVVGPYKGSKASEVQMTLDEYEARVASQGGGHSGQASGSAPDDDSF